MLDINHRDEGRGSIGNNGTTGPSNRNSDLSGCSTLDTLSYTSTAANCSVSSFSLNRSISESSEVDSGQAGNRGFSRFVQVQHGMPKILKSLIESGEISSIIRFFPVLMTQLLRLLVTTTSDDVSNYCIRVMIHVLHNMREVRKDDIALSYVEYFFTSESIVTNNISVSGKLTLHEELIRSLVSILKHSGGEFPLINNLIENSWFFLQLISKSMANHLLTSGRIKMHRAERFSKEFMETLLTFIDLFLPQIIEKHKELPYESKVANQNVSFFIRRCFALMDRGFVFRMIKSYLDRFHSVKDSVTLHHFKFEFLALITAYEHHVPINLPLKMKSSSRQTTIEHENQNGSREEDDDDQKTPTAQMSPTNKASTPVRTPDRKISLKMTQSFSGGKKRFSSMSSEELLDDETSLDEEFIKNHFTVGALLQEVKSALSEVHQIRGMALTVLRNLLVKHSFDDRYTSRSQQTRIASLYLPFLSVILENVNRIQVTGCSTGILSSSSSGSCRKGLTSTPGGGTGPGSSCHAMVTKRVSFMDSSAGSSPTNTIDPHNNHGLESFAKSIAARRTSSALESSSSLMSQPGNKRDSSYFQMIAGTAVSGSGPESTAPGLGSNFVSVSLEHISSSGLVTVTHNSSSSPLNSSDPEISSKSPSPDMVSSSGVSSASDLSSHHTPHHHPSLSHQFSTNSLESHSSLLSSGSRLQFHQRSHSLPIRFDKLNSSEARDMLIIFSWIVKHVSEDSLTSFLKRSSDVLILNFMSLHEMCLHEFKYSGKNSMRQIYSLAHSQSGSSGSNTLMTGIKNSSHVMFSHPESKSMTLPARMIDPNVSTDERTSELFSGLLEANLATEIGLVTIDVFGLLTKELSDRLTESNGDNLLMKKMFAIYLSFLQLGQSENLLRHLFASFRCFVNKFPTVLFSGSPGYVGQLCFELLKCCSSRISSVRSESAALLYLLMRANFHFTQQQSMTRVHLQIIIAVSKLLGDATLVLLNNSRFQESLAIINNFASSDISMKTTKFPNEVRELTKKIRTVLMATAAMREHESDPEMLMDLQSSLANSYAETSPALRRTWLESMAKNHMKDGNFSEAAMCLAHVAALESGILRKRTQIQKNSSVIGLNDSFICDESSIKWRCPGPEDFDRISCNVPRDESNSGSKSCDMSSSFFSLGLTTSLSGVGPDGLEDQHDFSEDSLIETLESAATLFARSERFEMVPEVYKIMIPFHEKRRNFDSLSKIYKTVSATYEKIIQVQRTGKRIFGRFYRIAFYGREFFDEESGKEFVYKEPKVTSLPEISDRLKDIFGKKFGPENIKLIMAEKEVDEKMDCDPKFAYIQVTHVHPWNHSIQPNDRKTDFEKLDNNLNKFMFETPFSMSDPSKTHSASCHDQCKRRTVLTTLYHFPYVVKRIPVISKSVQILSPIEVAIDEMESRVKELDSVINYPGKDSGSRPDLKKLQLKLQGSVSVQVNAGPLAYARSFLPSGSKDSHGHHFPIEKVNQLKDVFMEFIEICEMGMELNERFIGQDQHEYHQSMRSNLDEMTGELSQWLNPNNTSNDSNHSSPLHHAVSTDTLTGDGHRNGNSRTNNHNNNRNHDQITVNGHKSSSSSLSTDDNSSTKRLSN